ncbi:hypothetical protein ACWK66_004712, partial [Enterobacter cloacae]
APRPGLQETPQQFTAGPGHRCKLFIFLKQHSSLSVKKYWGSLNPQGEGWGEGIRPHRPGKKAQNACSTSRHFFICI